jgi:hypothetical protein
MTAADRRLANAAREVRKYWRDWPQERRDGVRSLSGHLADAIEAMCVTVESEPNVGTCGACGDEFTLLRNGRLRQHNGQVFHGTWRQVCDGSGEYPEVAS